ncbi:MAG TPA: glycosyltransferase family 87 protein [Gemmataceae bacterium]|nr:glycosyltransferase family 87 protein [Gemmataceae bacterium]
MQRLRSWLTRFQQWKRLAIILWTILIVAISVRGLLAPRHNSVYPIFSTAARNWVHGNNLYEDLHDPYRYSPLVTVLFVPLSLLPDRVGGVLWRLLNAGAYLGALWCWSQVALPGSLTKRQLGLLFLLVIPLSLGSINNGQSNPLILGLMLTGIVCVLGERWNIASGCVALACLFKVYPIAIGMLLAVIHPRRFGGRFALVLAMGLLAPFVLQRPEYVSVQYASWFHRLQVEDRQVESPEYWYRDLRLLCNACHIPVSPPAYLAIQLAAAAASAAVCLGARRRGSDSRELHLTLLGLACCWMTLFGSAAESCTYILLAPTISWALISAWMTHHPFWIRSTLVMSFTLFTASAMSSWFPGGRHFHTLGPQPLAALFLWIFLLATALPRSIKPLETHEREFESLPSRAA